MCRGRLILITGKLTGHGLRKAGSGLEYGEAVFGILILIASVQTYPVDLTTGKADR